MSQAPPTLLVVDDEDAIRRLLRCCFEAEGFRVVEAADGAGMFRALETEKVDLVTLDVGLGAENGLDLARRVRADSDVGLIMVTGKGDMIDTVVGLEIGADDYIAKPFELREVLARVRALLRRVRDRTERNAEVHAHSPPSAPSVDATKSPAKARDEPGFRFGDCTLWPRRRELVCAPPRKAAHALTSAEFDLLEVLVANAQQVLSRDRLMDRLKGQDWHPNDRTIDNQVARLRRKLEAFEAGDLIRTVRGIGYLFAADVVRIGRHNE